MKLLICIPALNEEAGIDDIIRRSLDARRFICENSPVDEVIITVVSDGSTDRTVEIARRYTEEINLVVFPQNRGYGAAIKEAWSRSDADILGFLDADGTCDPRFFAPLCARLAEQNADVTLGCRLNRESKMPVVRRVGNAIFAAILAGFSSARVRDTASGMRVVRRSALHKLFPLPDGLHFTPAMSARSMLSDNVKLIEIDMPYRERAGESKLEIIKDGLRFLRVILETAFLYRPSRALNAAGLVLALSASVLMLPPSIFYVENHSLLSWMIYRFLVADVFGIAACLLFCAGYLTDRVVPMVLPGEIKGRKPLAHFFRSRWFWLVPAAFTALGISLVFSSVVERLRFGGTDMHWSRYVAMTFCLSVALIATVTRIIDFFLEMAAERVNYLAIHFAQDLLPKESTARVYAATAGGGTGRVTSAPPRRTAKT